MKWLRLVHAGFTLLLLVSGAAFAALVLRGAIEVRVRPGSRLPQAVQAAPGGEVKARLLVVRGARPNTEYPICEGRNLIGRADEQPVDIDLEFQEFAPDRIWSSRQHAAITCAGGALVIEDLGSANGTYVNRRRVPPGEKRAVRGGDIIQIGEVQLKVLR